MRISVVMPSMNQRGFLEGTLASVLTQEGVFDLEVLVMDGGSTDGTKDYLAGLDDERVRWVSEPDRGQSDAVNKGLARATGDVVGWLNSDDLYAPGALAAVVSAFESAPTARWVVGRCEVIDEQGATIRQFVTRHKDRRLARYRYRDLLRENFISQMAVFWRRDFGETVGPLDETLFYTMDYDLWLRMGARRDPVILDQVVAAFRLHRGSKSGQVKREQFDEEYRVACRYLEGDRLSGFVHRLNVERTVWAYRLMRLFGR